MIRWPLVRRARLDNVERILHSENNALRRRLIRQREINIERDKKIDELHLELCETKRRLSDPT